MPLFRPNTVVLQPSSTYILHAHQQHIMHGKIDRNHGKINWNRGKFNENYWKNRWKLWVNQWTPWKNRLKPWKINEQCKWHMLAPKFSKVQANSKENCTRLKNKQKNKKLHPDKKVDGVAARYMFRSQNAKNTTCPDHFWKLRCWKSGWRCGAKHISKWTC